MYTDDKADFSRMCGRSDGCGCEKLAEGGVPCADRRTWGLVGYPVGMVYAPIQVFDSVYDLDTALKRGTLFGVLDLPFVCGDKKKGGCSCD